MYRRGFSGSRKGGFETVKRTNTDDEENGIGERKEEENNGIMIKLGVQREKRWRRRNICERRDSWLGKEIKKGF